ncbi:MAG: metallophosphoesterase [Pseudomonadota bacterium]
MRLIHLTDPHLTDLSDWRPGLTAGKRWLSWLSWRRKRRFHHRRETLDLLVDQLKRYQPDLFAVTGDLCQIGLEQEMIEAADWLTSLREKAEVLLVPGNHDLFASDSIKAAHRHWSDFLHFSPGSTSWPTQIDFGSVAVIGLNSSLPTAPLLASGKLGRELLQRLKSKLNQLNDRFRVIMLHHPPLPGLSNRRKGLQDVKELAELLKQSGADLVLHGHLHRNQQHELKLSSGQTLPVFCTASASSSGHDLPASARLFEVLPLSAESDRKRYSVEMKLLALDSAKQLQVIDQTRWQTG